ncbi:MAG: hypothetical protein HY728_02645 [Candidatus Rokubacteria bacterium]|nr:hypothetical protein [Candidatus Rokubacteria bacterium]
MILIVVGAVVARGNVNERLVSYPDHWAFLSAWLLFLAYWVIPPLLFWFLDHTGAVQDTSLFAALIVAFGYRQLFAGGIQGVNLPGQAASLWKPFQAWVDKVADRIAGRQKRYIDRFAELLRRDVTRDPGEIQKLELLALQRSTNLAQLRQAIATARAIPEPEVAQSRLFDHLWPDLRTSAPDSYGFLLHKHGLVTRRRRWWYLDRGRAKLVAWGSLLALVLLAVGIWRWSSNDPRGTTLWETGQRCYYQWRFLKPNSSERDRWRARAYFAHELTAAATHPPPPVADARAAAQRALDEVAKARQAVGDAKTPEEQARAKAALAAAEATRRAALEREARAVHTDALLRPLIKELRYPEISSRQLDEILRLVMNHHGPYLDAYYVPELIESLRTSNEVARLNIHRTVLALQKADYPKAPPRSLELVKWEPRKNESADDIDRFVRLWHDWWRAIQAQPRA